MGFVRLFLASLVLLSHMGYTVLGFNPGVAAVVVFYLLAGNVVARLWAKAPSTGRLGWFFRDRAWRILPMYYCSLLCAALIWWWLRPDSFHVSKAPGAFEWFANSIILPLNYFMYNGVDQFTLLAPAWSLAAELQFYLLVPLLLSYRYILYVAFSVSLVVFFAAQVGLLDADVFGYRLLAGVLFVFLSGVLWVRPSATQRIFLLSLWLVCCFYAALLLSTVNPPSFVVEVAVGYAVGVPVLLLSPVLRQYSTPALHRTQQLAGIYSYGVFLIHCPIIWCIQPWLGTSFSALFVLWVASVLYAALAHRFFEQPLWRRFRPTLGTSSV